MSRYASPKCCGLCGRWGTAGFREADGSDQPGYSPDRDGKWVCSSDRACKRRSRRVPESEERCNRFRHDEHCGH